MKTSVVALGVTALTIVLAGCSGVGSTTSAPPMSSSIATTPVAVGSTAVKALTPVELGRARNTIWAKRTTIAQQGLAIAAATDIEARPDGQPGIVVYGKFTTVNARTNPSGVAEAVQSLVGVPVVVDVVTPQDRRRHLTANWVTVPSKAPAQPSTP